MSEELNTKYSSVRDTRALYATGFKVIGLDNDESLSLLVKEALRQRGGIRLPVITPREKRSTIGLEIDKWGRGYYRVLIDTYPSSWDISKAGQATFYCVAREYPEDTKEPFCGKRVMRIDVRRDTTAWGAGLWLIRMLNVLGESDSLEEIGLSIKPL